MLRPDLEHCKETGVALADGSRVIVMPDSGGVGAALVQRLQKLGVEVLEIDPAAGREGLAQQLADWLQAGPIQGIYWLRRPRRLARAAGAAREAAVYHRARTV